VRIVVVDPRGDSRPYDDALCEALAARGHDVELVTARFRFGALPPAGGFRVRTGFYLIADRLPDGLRRKARGLEHAFDLALLLLRLRRRPPDVVHVQWLPMGGVDRLAWQRYRGLRVLTAHNALAKPGVPGEDGRAARLFDAVVVHSSAGAAALAGERRVAQIPHLALSTYRRVAPEPIAGVPTDVPAAAFVGSIRPYKGLDVLLDAWPEVRRQVPGATLIVAGRPFGDEASAARAADAEGVVARLGYAAPGVFAGAIERASCVVLPYRGIDMSGVLAAALALGRPVVVTDVGGMGEVVAESGAGVVVPADDPDALAAAVAGLLADPARCAAMAAAARAAADGPYAPARIAELHEALYSSLMP
jgi:glycosyltransferase involved in cell wall biosynthesis